MASNSPIALAVKTDGFTAFYKAVKASDKQLAASLRKQLQTVGNTVRDRAKGNASWSARIPSSIKTSVTQKGVSVKAGGAKAPHAAAFEHGGKPGMFRHPVFGNREMWVNQPARPYLAPAMNADEAAAGVLNAIDEWVRSTGFR